MGANADQLGVRRLEDSVFQGVVRLGLFGVMEAAVEFKEVQRFVALRAVEDNAVHNALEEEVALARLQPLRDSAVVENAAHRDVGIRVIRGKRPADRFVESLFLLRLEETDDPGALLLRRLRRPDAHVRPARAGGLLGLALLQLGNHPPRKRAILVTCREAQQRRAVRVAQGVQLHIDEPLDEPRRKCGAVLFNDEPDMRELRWALGRR